MPITDERSQSAVVGVVVQAGCLLVVKRSQQVIAPGQYCFCGGMCGPSESESQALIREFREELDVTIKPRTRHWQSVTPWDVPVSWWTAALEPGEEIQANPREIESFGWYSMEDLRSLDPLLESNRQWIDAYDRGEFTIAWE